MTPHISYAGSIRLFLCITITGMTFSESLVHTHLLNKRFSILGFLVRSTVDQHPTVELDSLGTDHLTVPIPSHSTCTYVILLLDFSTKDLFTTSAVGTTTALTRLTSVTVFCCLLQLWRLWMTFHFIRRICSWSATLSAARLFQLSSIHGILFSI